MSNDISTRIASYATEKHALYDKHPKVSSLMKVHENTYNSIKYGSNMQMPNKPVKNKVVIKQ